MPTRPIESGRSGPFLLMLGIARDGGGALRPVILYPAP